MVAGGTGGGGSCVGSEEALGSVLAGAEAGEEMMVVFVFSLGEPIGVKGEI